MLASASPISPGPSNSSDRPSSGSGGTRLAQTSIASGSGGCATRVIRFVTPHAAAAPRISRNGRIGAAAARSTPMTTSPAKAIPAPITCSRRGRSCRITAAKPIVNTTWSWSSSDESPAGIPRSSEMNSSPNLTTPSRKPNAMTILHGTCGRPTRKIGGERHEREPQGVEEQRREVLQPFVDDDEVDAPDGGHEHEQGDGAGGHGGHASGLGRFRASRHSAIDP